jgi:phosphomannomutase
MLSTRDNLDGPVINSIVSSPLLGDIAAHHGVPFTQTLTGFKWICNASLDLIDQGEGPLIMGYEEALGYSIGDTVRDKDGISAAVAFAVLTAIAAGDGATVVDRLGDMYRRYGVWTSAQVSIRREGSEGAADIERAMRALREATPGEILDFPVVAVTDYSTGAESRPRYLGATNLIELDLGDAGRLLARPSGTEPKLKVYVDLKGPFPESGDWIGAEAELASTATEAGEALAAWLTERMGG